MSLSDDADHIDVEAGSASEAGMGVDRLRKVWDVAGATPDPVAVTDARDHPRGGALYPPDRATGPTLDPCSEVPAEKQPPDEELPPF